MKFLVPNYSCLQNPWLEFSLSSTEFVDPPHPPLDKIPGYATAITSSIFQSCPAATLFYICFINCIFQLILLSEWLLFILSIWSCKKIYYYFLWSLLCVRHNIALFYITLYSLCVWHNTMFWAKFLIHFPRYEFTPELVATKCRASVFILLLYIYEALGLSLTPESSYPDWGFDDP